MSSLYTLGGPHSSTTAPTRPHRLVFGHPGISAATFRPPFPALISSRLGAHRRFLFLGHSAGCWAAPCGPARSVLAQSRPNPGPRGSDRDTSGLMGGGTYMSEARPRRDIPLWAVGVSGQNVAAGCVTSLGGAWRNQLQGLDVRLAHRSPGKLAGGTPLTRLMPLTPLTRLTRRTPFASATAPHRPLW